APEDRGADRRALPRHPAERGRGPGRGAPRGVLLRLPPPDPALPPVRHDDPLRRDRGADRVLVPALPERAQPPRELDPRAPGGPVVAGLLRRSAMRTAPASPTASEVLALARRHWVPGASTAAHLPLGFGAHHWRVAYEETGAALFMTLDEPSPTRTADSFVAAYRAAQRLAGAGAEGGLAPLDTLDGRVAVPCAGGLLSATPWRDGRSPAPEEAARAPHRRRVRALLESLHAADPPAALRPWAARVGPDLTDRLAAVTATPWQE